MKKIFYFIIIIILFTGCKKKDNTQEGNGLGGKILVNLTYKSTAQKSGSDTKSGQYSQFGDYITSITPTTFIGKFLDMRLISSGVDFASSPGFNIIDNNTEMTSPSRLADFSKNASVNFTPNVPRFNSDLVLNLFVFMPMFYFQEFDLPLQYDNVTILRYLTYSNEGINLANDFIGGLRNGRHVRGSHQPFMAAIFDPAWGGGGNFPPVPSNYVFGSTDSTYIFNSTGQFSINNPLSQTGYIIRSNAYNALTLQPVPEGETKTVTGTMTFDINNLIQIYAGADNIPYTSDDIFVYAPRFWERLSVNLSAI